MYQILSDVLVLQTSPFAERGREGRRGKVGGGGEIVWHNFDRHIILIIVDCVCSRCVISCYILVGVYHQQV